MTDASSAHRPDETPGHRPDPGPTQLRSRFGVSSMFRQGSGRPLLWLHAAGGAGMWDPYLARLAEHFDVIAPDHPGFGRSPELDGVDSVPALVEHYLSVLDNLELDRVNVVGASFGGWLAAEIASTVPERIERLVLMAPAGLLIAEAPPANLGAMTPAEVVGALYWDRDIVETILSTPPAPEIAAFAERNAAAAGAYVSRSGLHNPDLPGRLSRITAPTLVITPEVDNLIPRPHSEAYAAAITGANLRVIPDIGHALYQEQPDLIADAVIAFLS